MRRSSALVRLLLRLFPRDFRELHGDGLTADFPPPDVGAGRLSRVWHWTRAAVDLVGALVGVWWDRFGNGDAARRGATETRRNGMENLVSDVRYALRGLLRSPGFTIMAVLTIALGIGANAAIFSVVNGVLLKPLPYEDSDELTQVFGRFLPVSGFDFPYFAIDPTEYLDLRDHNAAFESLAAYTTQGVTLVGEDGRAERRSGVVTTWNLFEVLGLTAEAGRTLTSSDDIDGGPHVVVLSHALWEERFGADPSLIGRTIDLDRQSYEVVGVLPEGVAFPTPDADLYLPLQLSDNPSGRQSHYLRVIGRRADRVSLEAASAEIARLMSVWEADYPEIHTGHFLFLEGYKDAIVGPARPVLLLLLGAVGVVLLVACANVANLMLVRGQARQGEVALRRALGAARWRIVQFGLAESSLLAVAGAALGVLLARLSVPMLLRLNPGAVPLSDAVAVDLSVLAFAGALAVATVVLFGLLPSLHASGAGGAEVMREEGRGRTSSRGRVRARSALVATEVALSFVLVLGAGLMVRTIGKLLAEDPGFETEGRMVASVSLPVADYPEPGDGTRFFDEVLARAEALPGVTAATLVVHLPMRSGQSVNDFVLEGTEEPGPGQPTWNAGVTAVRANYFDAMGIEVLNGRGFDAILDGASGSPISVVVSRGLVDRFLPGVDPLGRRMRFAGTEDQQWWTIVGVVEDLQYQSLGNQGSPMYYLLPEPLSRVGGSGWDRGGWIVLETDADRPLEYADPLRRIVAEADPNVPVTNLGTLDSIVGESIARQRFIRTLLGAFAGLALALGAIGVYGVTSFGVSQRRHELGIHRALGAESGRVMSLVIRQGLAPVAIGLAVGVLAAASTGRFLGSLLFGIEPSDLPTYGAVFVVLFSVAFVAVWLPARRAARLDPMASLRSD